MNLVSIKQVGGQFEGPGPGDTCSNHKTLAEDRSEDRAIAQFRERIGLPPRATNEDD